MDFGLYNYDDIKRIMIFKSSLNKDFNTIILRTKDNSISINGIQTKNLKELFIELKQYLKNLEVLK